MITSLHAHPATRRLTAGWLLLALAALACSTLCAVLLIVARTPLLAALGASGDLFRRALVLHVGLAVLVWFLACACALWTLASGRGDGAARWSALGLAGAGVAAMLATLLAGLGQPVLANYVPVLDHPLFLAGLLLFVAGVALCGACALGPLLGRLRAAPPWRLAATLSLVPAAAALAVLAAALWQHGGGPSPADVELLAWGPGHLLQFVHLLLLMGAWSVLGEQVLGQPVLPRPLLAGLLLLACAPLLAVPAIHAVNPHGGAALRHAYTLLMATASWPAPLLLALRLLQLGWRARRTAWAAPGAPALLLSVLLFVLGCTLGALIRADSTMVPAHYHGTVGAVTLAYMALGVQLLPAFGAQPGAALRRRQPLLYGGGLLLLALGLAWSGALGVPRKTMHVDVLVQYPAYGMAMGLAGLGGLLALAGAALFVLRVAGSLLAARRQGAGVAAARFAPAVPAPQHAPARGAPRDSQAEPAPPKAWPAPRWRDARPAAFGLTLASTAGLALLLSYWPAPQGVALPPPAAPAAADAAAAAPAGDHASTHAATATAQEVARRFGAAAALLNERQYEAAASELHRVLALAPQLPEAHVNMGFALVGAGRPAMAHDFFEVALKLNVNQHNAYFGLALALEGEHDIEGALGAMRSYVHLSQPGDAYLPQAQAAIARWDAVRTRAIPANGNAVARVPKNGKIAH